MPVTRRGRAGLAATAALLSLFSGCDARTGLDYGPPLPPVPECEVDADCAAKNHDLCRPMLCEHLPVGGGQLALEPITRCVAQPPKDCNDNDPCTIDTCDPATGVCVYKWATPDADGDGYYAPLPGYAPGSPGSCGDDCDDANPNVHPGAPEICDG